MNRKRLCAAFGTMAGLTFAVGPLHAKDIAADYTQCGAGTTNVLSTTKEATLLAAEHRAVIRSNIDDKTLDNQSMHCAGVTKIVDGQNSTTGYCKFVSAEGDWYVVEYARASAVADNQGTWRALQGSGRWQGISGGGIWKSVTSARPVTAGTFQYCVDAKGKYTLPN